MGDGQLGMIELVQRFAKMDDHQIAFVAEQRKQPGGRLLVLLKGGEVSYRRRERLVPFRLT